MNALSDKRHARPSRVLRLCLMILSLVTATVSAVHLARTVDRFLSVRTLTVPDDDRALRDTILVELAHALATDSFDGRIMYELQAGEIERARVLYLAATGAGRPLAPATIAAYQAATDGWQVWWRHARDAGLGAVAGRGEGPAGLVGAFAFNLALPTVADGRDASIELYRMARGQDPDRIMLGLSLVGLALPALDFGMAPIKAALRLGGASRGLVGELRRLAGGMVDLPGLRGWLKSGSAVTEPMAVTRFLRPAGLRRAEAVAGDLGGILKDGGSVAAMAALKQADGLAELALHRRVATVFRADAGKVTVVLGKRLPRLFMSVGKVTARLVIELVGLALGVLLSLLGLLVSLGLRPLRRAGRRFVLRRVDRWWAQAGSDSSASVSGEGGFTLASRA